jgi:hypothetical protein
MSLTINFYMAKWLLQMGYQAEVGMNRLDWVLCYQDTEKSVKEVEFWMHRLAVSNAMLASETDPYRRAELQKAADSERFALVNELKAFVEARLSAKSRDDDPSWCGPAFSRRLKAMPALLNDAGTSYDAALAAGGTFLSTIAQAVVDWDHIIMERK